MFDQITKCTPGALFALQLQNCDKSTFCVPFYWFSFLQCWIIKGKEHWFNQSCLNQPLISPCICISYVWTHIGRLWFAIPYTYFFHALKNVCICYFKIWNCHTGNKQRIFHQFHTHLEHWLTFILGTVLYASFMRVISPPLQMALGEYWELSICTSWIVNFAVAVVQNKTEQKFVQCQKSAIYKHMHTHTHRIWTEILISKWKDKRTREKHSKQIEFMCLCRAFHSSFVPQSMGNYCASVWEKRHGEDLEKKQVQNREIKPCVSAVQSRANIKGLSPSSAPAEQAGVCALIGLESCHIIHSLWNVR